MECIYCQELISSPLTGIKMTSGSLRYIDSMWKTLTFNLNSKEAELAELPVLWRQRSVSIVSAVVAGLRI